MTHITAENVSFGYTTSHVVRDISFTIEPGAYVGLVGPNGSGKSTLLQLLLGLHEPDRGQIELFDSPTRAFVDRERVGYVAQDVTTNTKEMPITVEEVVLMGRFPHAGFGRITDDDRERARAALRTAGIDHLAEKRITKLSGGQRQRTYIARALAGEADLLVFDEPTVGVDAESVDDFFDLLETLNDDGMTILLVEHDIEAVIEYTERVLCLNRELYFDGPSEDFLDSDALEQAYGITTGNEAGGGR